MFISFLSDYGNEDEFVGICHAVIARRCPDARVIDLDHAIPRDDVLAGALTLASAVRFLPAGVVLAVVDPGVGGERRALALRSAGSEQLFVGPDNGLLTAALERLGGIAEAVEIGGSSERLQPVSSTFHGRDVFAPVAGALAAGEPLGAVGEPVAAESIVRLELPRAQVTDGGLLAHVIHIDSFGNVALDATPDQLAALDATLGQRAEPGSGTGEDTGPDGGTGARSGRIVTVVAGGRRYKALLAANFAEAPEGGLLLYEDSWGMLALAVNHGSAAALLGAETGRELRLEAR